MLITVICAVMMMAGLFIMLYAGVALIQDKRFFTSAPKEVQAAVQPRDERFPGAHALGWCLIALSFTLFIGAVVLGGWDGIRNGFPYWKFLVRFTAMLWLLKAYDIMFFDFVLLCRSSFFPRFYPETKPALGPHLFGYNKKTHILHIVLSPAVAAALAGICVWIM